ncbi:MAG: hypothetical protein EHM21_03945 [Chloroflexi bacterium]|nr:MAG: hypothetical protein EHM21_03945 [Chloroflexota bacterium]
MDKSDFGYSSPAARLLTIGDPLEVRRDPGWRGGPDWPDYPAEYGLGPEHVPDLIRMATDEALNQARSDTREVWAPIHARRALGQMRAVEAVEPLLGVFHLVDDEDDDYVGEELPQVMGMIGPEAIPALAKYLASRNNGLWARVAASGGLEKIGASHPDARRACVAALTATLENYANNDELLNAFIISRLEALDAAEAAPLVEQAYKADRVDESILGDWEDFQVGVGLLEEQLSDPDNDLNTTLFPTGNEPYPQKTLSKKEEKKEKNKRKQAKESRKKNRKKKK